MLSTIREDNQMKNLAFDYSFKKDIENEYYVYAWLPRKQGLLQG